MKKIKKTGKCCICGGKYDFYGNNADPIKKYGRCCAICDAKFVIPMRSVRISDKQYANNRRERRD